MANYYLNSDGSLTKQNPKKKKGNNYILQSDGSLKLNAPVATKPKTTVTGPTTTVSTGSQQLIKKSERQNIPRGMESSYAALEEVAKRQVEKTAKEKNLRNSQFNGLTNATYKEYLDNLESNAKDEKQKKWLQKQKDNLEKLKDKKVRSAVEDAVFASKTSLTDSGRLVNELSKHLSITYEEAESLFDTVEREKNAKHNETMMEKADNLTEKGIGGKVAAQILGIGAGLESTFGGLESIRATVNEKVFDNYEPLDTNKQAFTGGDFKERVSGNIQQAIERENPSLARKGLGVLYQGASGAADSLTTARAFGPAAPFVMAAQAVGSSSKDAFERTGSNAKATATGLVSGVIEYGTEKMGLDNLWDIMKGSGKAATRSALVNILGQAGIEGVEEATSETLGTVADWIINKADSNLEQNVQKHKKDGKTDKEAWTAAALDALKEVGQAGLVGAISGGISGSAASALGMDTFSKNENKVIDKEVENRITEREKDGTKLKATEKAKIRKEVEQALKEGDISIDTIESALGGETLQKYNSLVEQEESLTKQLEELGKQSNTVANAKKYDEVSAKLKEMQDKSEKTALKEQLSKEVSDMTLSDTYIRKSYNEKGRRSQAFEADLSKYNAKQQATIQKAIDSKILNNTNKTHKFVDLLAKISADKGVSFDFTDNVKLKESGFAIQGATVNGYVKDGNVTLNINSAKALNSVVGHELTHVLEGTEHYAALQEAVFEYAKTKKDYDGRLKTLTELYKNVENADVNKELTADLIGDYLFTDEKFVQQLSTQNRNVFQKIYNEIKYLVKTVTSGSKEAKQLEKVKKMFDDAYKEMNTQKSNVDNKRVQYDVSEDTELYQYIQDALDGKVSQKSYYKITDSIPERLANDIEKIVGFSVEGYGNKISPNHIQHISDRHGAEGKADQSMKDMHDLAKIGFVIENYENIREGEQNYQYRNKDNSYAKTVVLQKKIDDGFYYVVEAVPDAKAKTLYVVSAYQNKNDTFSEEGVQKALNPNAQSELQLNVSSNNSISQKQKNTTGNEKKSISNNDISPTGSWNVKGKDLALEGVPIRQDIAPAQKKNASTSKKQMPPQDDIESWRPYISEDLTIGPFSPEGIMTEDDLSEGMFSPAEETTGQEGEQQETAISKKNTERIKNIQANIKGLQMSRDIMEKEVDSSIATKTSEYENLKNKDTKKAAHLLTQIENLRYRRDNALAEIDKKIKQQKKAIKNIKNREIAGRRKTKQQQYRSLMSNLIGDTSTWKDKKLGISYQTNTLRRNLRDIVRDADGKRDIAKADAIYEELQGKYNQHEAELHREANRIKQVFKDMKINKAENEYIQMLGEYRHNPDSTITPEVIQEFYEKNKDKIDDAKVDKAIDEARKAYDSLFYRVNDVLKEHGFRELGYKEGYFPHFTEDKQHWLAKLLNWKTQNNDIPTDIAGLTEQFSPERSWQSFDKHRTGDKTDYNFMKGLDTYVQGSLDWIYHIEDIQKRRALENEIRYQHSDKGIKEKLEEIYNSNEYDTDEMQEQIDLVLKTARNPLNNFVTDLRNSTNNLARKKDTADRSLEYATNRKIYSTMTNLSNRVSANMVGGSISSALTNFIPITQSWGEVKPVSSLKAMRETIKSYMVDDGMVDKSDFMTNRLKTTDNLYQTQWDKITDKVSVLMNGIDNFTTQVVWRSKYMENIETGMTEDAAIKSADQFAEDVMAGRSRGNMPTIFNSKNPITKVFTAFQLEVSNQYGYMFKDLPQDVGSKSMAKLVQGYGTMFIGAYVYNALYSSLTGRDAAFDPIGIIEQLLRDLGAFGEEEEKEPLDVLFNLGGNLMDEMPYVGGLLGGGRIPISSALPYDSPKEAITGTLEDVADGNWKNLTWEWLNPVFYLGMPVGGGQTRKTIQGLSMFDKDLPISGSYTNSGELRFPVEDTPSNKAQAAVFGQYASKNARDYFENNRSPLKDKQLEEFLESKLPIQEYWNYRDGLKGLRKLEEKADYIAGLDIPVSTKNMLINNQSTREQDIDLTDYDKYGTFEELDCAIKHPERYAISKAFSEYKVYDKYRSKLSKIEGDKDDKGNTINGSKKEKILERLEEFDLDYGEKLLLFKEKYPGDDTYDYEIVTYLNNRTDIKDADRKDILKGLGFKLNKNGTVRW